jgi:MYXO-CTERM domain-containing protein
MHVRALSLFSTSLVLGCTAPALRDTAGTSDGRGEEGPSLRRSATTAVSSGAPETKLTASDAAASASYGDAVSAGDLNGDGYDDLIVGAPGVSNLGQVYVYYGTATGVDTSSEQRLTASDGGGGDRFGDAVAGVGDLDGDGYDDVIIGAYGAGVWAEGFTDSGAAYVYYGSSTGVAASSEQRISASDESSYAYFGISLARAGDVDGDGYDDVVIGAWGDSSYQGAAYVYLGSATGLAPSTEQKLTASDSGSGDHFSKVLSGGGDIDGDGYDDLVIGMERDDDGGTDAGAAYLYYGSATGIAASSEQKLTASDTGAGQYFGHGLDLAGDLDADGYDDVVVGAVGDADAGVYAGAGYVYYGSATGLSLATEQKLTASDAVERDQLGGGAAGAGDLDGDGFDDIVLGAAGVDDGGSSSGAAYIYYGSASGVLAASEEKLTASDADSSDLFGQVLASAGDLDGDGYDDLILGVAGDDDDGSGSGAAYVYSGGYRDADGDGAVARDDCDETDAAVNPSATEGIGDELDQDCDGAELCYQDADDDGYTDGTTTVVSTDTDCTDPGEGLATDPTGECDDTDATVNPGATEGVGDEVDQDCDGQERCWVDRDDDGYTVGNTMVAVSLDADCSDPGEGLATDPAGDCDDTNNTVNPGATEGVGDEVDQDCDWQELCYQDADDDGYTDGTTTVLSTDSDCTDPGEGLATDPTGECDDTDAAVNPSATEGVGDEVDQDCDGQELCYQDADDDGYTDGTTTVLSTDADCADPGEGLATDPTGECDDTDAAVNPGAVEVCDEAGVDEDCDGLTEDTDDSVDPDSMSTWHSDSDGDGHGDPDAPVRACAQPDDAVTDSTDCDDTDAAVHPGATELPDDGIDQDCDGADATSPGTDGDGGGDGDGDGDGDKGSGCATTGTPASLPWGLLGLAVGVVGLRRRR